MKEPNPFQLTMEDHTKNNLVDHPPHYNFGKIEVIEVIEDWGLNYNRGCVVKYTARAGKKDPAKECEDLEKAIWYLRRELETIKAKRENRVPVRPNAMNEKSQLLSSSNPSLCKILGRWDLIDFGGLEKDCFIPTDDIETYGIERDKAWVVRK